MTTKTVAVQLVALTQQYQKAMGGATASTAKLQAASGAAGKSIGSVMGPQIAIAGAVVAGVAVKMAYDWDNAFTRIAAVTDTSAAQVGKWKEQVLALAGETAQAPQELADALYFLASAGLETDQVMATLEMSAKASAVGLGETADIARLTANAINAYSKSGLTAAQVTDTLVAAVREGTAEPDEFADAMGRILPIAAKAGISFDQVAASLAGLSNIGLDVNEGVTAMRGVMIALLAPGKQAQDMLAELGLSADDVRRSLAEDGLIATLRMLETATGGNIDMLRKIIPNVRAMAGAFGLTQQEAAKVDEIFQDVMESSGSLDKSLDKTKNTAGHKMRQAFVDLQVVGTQLGEEVLPLVVAGLQLVADVAGPVADAIGAVVDGFKMWGDAVTRDDTPTVVLHWREWKGALDAGTVSLDAAQRGLDRLKKEGGLTAGEVNRMQAAIDAARGAVEGAVPPVGELGGAVKKTGDDLADAEKAADSFSDALDRLTKVAFDVEEARLNWHQGLIDLREELRDGTKTLALNSQAGIDNREALKSQLENALAVGIAMREKGKSESEAAKVTQEHVRQVRAEAIAAGFAKDEVDAYIRTLNLTPKQISTLIKLNSSAAQSAVSRFIGDLDRIPDIKDVLIRVRSTGYGTGQQIGHAGGVVGHLPRYHGGGMSSDEQLVLARKGEHILTPQQYRSLRAAAAGGVVGAPDAAPAMGSVRNTIVVKVGEHVVRRIVVDALSGELVRT